MRPCDKNSRRGSRRLRTVISLETDFFNQTVLVIEKNRKNVYPSLMESAQHLINVYLYRERKDNCMCNLLLRATYTLMEKCIFCVCWTETKKVIKLKHLVKHFT